MRRDERMKAPHKNKVRKQLVLKPCPLCGNPVKTVGGPEDWYPTFYDPDSGGEPIVVLCSCGYKLKGYYYDYGDAIKAHNRQCL